MRQIIFTVTQEHIQLLKHMYVGWQNCEFGAPEIDPKRPYGNSNVIGDIAEILGIEPEEGDDFSHEQRSWMGNLHEETQTVLQIFLSTGEMKPGVYVNDRGYGPDWKWCGTELSSAIHTDASKS